MLNKHKQHTHYTHIHIHTTGGAKEQIMTFAVQREKMAIFRKKEISWKLCRLRGEGENFVASGGEGKSRNYFRFSQTLCIRQSWVGQLCTKCFIGGRGKKALCIATKFGNEPFHSERTIVSLLSRSRICIGRAELMLLIRPWSAESLSLISATMVNGSILCLRMSTLVCRSIHQHCVFVGDT